MAKLSQEEFTKQLQITVDQRARNYNRITGFAFRFEDDDTNAADDFTHLDQTLKIIGGDPAELFVLSKSSPFPQWDLEAEFHRHLTRLLTSDGRSLLIVHYSGHGFTMNNELMFGKGKGKHVSWAKILHQVTDRTMIEDDAPLDVVFIIDSCYSGLATRRNQSTKRIVEVIAAVNASGTALGNDPMNPRKQARTFTSKIADQFTLLKGKKADSIDFATIAAILAAESPVKKPTYKLVMGNTSICVSPSSNTNEPAPGPPAKEFSALVRLHLTQTLTSDDARSLKGWLRSLDKRFPLSLEGVYEAESTIIFLTMRHSMFLKLEGGGIQLVALVKGANLVDETPLPVLVPRLPSIPTSSDENVKPKGC